MSVQESFLGAAQLKCLGSFVREKVVLASGNCTETPRAFFPLEGRPILARRNSADVKSTCTTFAERHQARKMDNVAARRPCLE